MTLEEIVNSLKSAGQDYGQLLNNNPKYTAVASNVTKGLENLVPPQFTNTQDAKSQEYSKKLAEWALGNGMGMSGMALATKISNPIKDNLNAKLVQKYLSTGKLSPDEMTQYEANGLAMETPQSQRYNLENANIQGGTPKTRAKLEGYETAPKKELYHSAKTDWESNIVDPSRSDLGFHLGTLDQATNRLRVFGNRGVDLDAPGGNIIPIMKSKYANTLKLKDEGTFRPDVTGEQLEKKKNA